MTTLTYRAYRFGEFRLNQATRELHKGEQGLQLSPRLMDALFYLIERRGYTVDRHELAKVIWGHAHLSQSALGQVIRQLRQTLGDNGDDQRMIKTVRGYGYRWIAPIEASIETAPFEPAGLQLSTGVSGPAFRHTAAIAPVLVPAAAGYVLAWHGADSAATQHPDTTPSEHDIALVLPVNVKAPNRHHWLRFGIMELIAGRLDEASLHVVPGATAIALTSHLPDVPDAQEVQRLIAATGARLVISTQAEEVDAVWRVSIRALGAGAPALTVLAESNDPFEAARTAADRVALSLGLEPALDTEAEPQRVNLLKRAEAAMLAQQMDIARSVIESADAEVREKPEIRLQMALIEFHDCNLDAAERLFRSLMDDPEVGRNPRVLARAVNGVAVVHSLRGDQQIAMELMKDALELLEDENAPALAGTISRSLGAVLIRCGDFDAGRAYLARARRESESVGDANNLAILDNNIGVLETLRGRYVEALTCFERSAKYRATLHDLSEELRDLSNMVEVHLGLLQPNKALELLPRLNELIAHVSNPETKAMGLLAKSALLIENGRMQEGEAALSEALAAVSMEHIRLQERLKVTFQHAEFLADAGDYAAAGPVAEEVVDLALRSDNLLLHDYLGRAWLILLRAQLRERDSQVVGRTVAAIERWAAESPIWSSPIHAAVAQAELAVAERRDAAAQEAFEQALSLADASRVPLHLLQVTDRYVQWLVEQAGVQSPVSERLLVLGDRFVSHSGHHYGAALLQLRVYRAFGPSTARNAVLERAQALAGERIIPPALLSGTE